MNRNKNESKIVMRAPFQVGILNNIVKAVADPTTS